MFTGLLSDYVFLTLFAHKQHFRSAHTGIWFSTCNVNSQTTIRSGSHFPAVWTKPQWHTPDQLLDSVLTRGNSLVNESVFTFFWRWMCPFFFLCVVPTSPCLPLVLTDMSKLLQACHSRAHYSRVSSQSHQGVYLWYEGQDTQLFIPTSPIELPLTFLQLKSASVSFKFQFSFKV